MGLCECCCNPEKSRLRVELWIATQEGELLPATFVDKGYEATLILSGFSLSQTPCEDPPFAPLPLNLFLFGSPLYPASIADSESVLLFLYAYLKAIWSEFTVITSVEEAGDWVRLCKEAQGVGKLVIFGLEKDREEIQGVLDGGIGHTPLMVIHSLSARDEEEIKAKYSLLGTIEFHKVLPGLTYSQFVEMLRPFATRNRA